jgi:hypothetical protein
MKINRQVLVSGKQSVFFTYLHFIYNLFNNDDTKNVKLACCYAGIAS